VGDESGEQAVTEPVAPVCRLLAVNPNGADHVEPFAHELFDHGARAWRVIGGVAVDQNVDVGIDIREHPPRHPSFALMALVANHGAGLFGDGRGPVGRVVVIDIHGGFRQRGAKIADHLADGRLFVVARHQHRNRAAVDDLHGGICAPVGCQH
jgi:hypothetical protein